MTASRLTIRLTAAERAAIDQHAQAAGLPTSEHARRLLCRAAGVDAEPHERGVSDAETMSARGRRGAARRWNRKGKRRAE